MNNYLQILYLFLQNACHFNLEVSFQNLSPQFSWKLMWSLLAKIKVKIVIKNQKLLQSG